MRAWLAQARNRSPRSFLKPNSSKQHCLFHSRFNHYGHSSFSISSHDSLSQTFDGRQQWALLSSVSVEFIIYFSKTLILIVQPARLSKSCSRAKFRAVDPSSRPSVPRLSSRVAASCSPEPQCASRRGLLQATGTGTGPTEGLVRGRKQSVSLTHMHRESKKQMKRPNRTYETRSRNLVFARSKIFGVSNWTLSAVCVVFGNEIILLAKRSRATTFSYRLCLKSS